MLLLRDNLEEISYYSSLCLRAKLYYKHGLLEEIYSSPSLISHLGVYLAGHNNQTILGAGVVLHDEMLSATGPINTGVYVSRPWRKKGIGSQIMRGLQSVAGKELKYSTERGVKAFFEKSLEN